MQHQQQLPFPRQLRFCFNNQIFIFNAKLCKTFFQGANIPTPNALPRVPTILYGHQGRSKAVAREALA
jgi:hypothetical protein